LKRKNPGVRKYTWRGPDKKESGLDYFLVDMFPPPTKLTVTI
jgi:hypothetical protein